MVWSLADRTFQLRLVQHILDGQQTSDRFQQDWETFCDAQCFGTKDPRLIVLENLRLFLATTARSAAIRDAAKQRRNPKRPLAAVVIDGRYYRPDEAPPPGQPKSKKQKKRERQQEREVPVFLQLHNACRGCFAGCRYNVAYNVAQAGLKIRSTHFFDVSYLYFGLVLGCIDADRCK